MSIPDRLTDATPVPPVAPRRPTVLRAHGDERVDDWYWLRERDDPEVIAYLETENAYTRAMMADTVSMQEALYAEILDAMSSEDVDVRRRTCRCR